MSAHSTCCTPWTAYMLYLDTRIKVTFVLRSVHPWSVLFFQVWHQVLWFAPQYGHSVSSTEQKQPSSEACYFHSSARGRLMYS
jgi:hypothetical protein